ncbi:MAG: C-type lectin domain-containing protein, partial [Bacillota bacterium]|nr:C-type lectin domain-containing protein [Bacillota bacterium]
EEEAPVEENTPTIRILPVGGKKADGKSSPVEVDFPKRKANSEKLAERVVPDNVTPAVQYDTPKKKAAPKKAAKKSEAVSAESPVKAEAKPVEKKKKKGAFPYIIGALLLILAIELVITGKLWSGENNDVKNTAAPIESVEPSETVEPTVKPTETPAPLVSTYKIFVEDISWGEAEQKCTELGGHLVCINDEQEYNKICEMLYDYSVSYVWIGCYRDNTGNLVWTNNGTTEFYPWAPSEPSMTDSYDGTIENYLMLTYQPDGSWMYNDSRSNPLEDYAKYYSGRIAYICEIES